MGSGLEGRARCSPGHSLHRKGAAEQRSVIDDLEGCRSDKVQQWGLGLGLGRRDANFRLSGQIWPWELLPPWLGPPKRTA